MVRGQHERARGCSLSLGCRNQAVSVSSTEGIPLEFHPACGTQWVEQQPLCLCRCLHVAQWERPACEGQRVRVQSLRCCVKCAIQRGDAPIAGALDICSCCLEEVRRRL